MRIDDNSLCRGVRQGVVEGTVLDSLLKESTVFWPEKAGLGRKE